eukprot:m.105543 g.105543  ORF g.105543 m.105543 type:complete len:689 (+) comp13280_c0_seq3:61-2127(+)
MSWFAEVASQAVSVLENVDQLAAGALQDETGELSEVDKDMLESVSGTDSSEEMNDGDDEIALELGDEEDEDERDTTAERQIDSSYRPMSSAKFEAAKVADTFARASSSSISSSTSLELVNGMQSKGGQSSQSSTRRGSHTTTIITSSTKATTRPAGGQRASDQESAKGASSSVPTKQATPKRSAARTAKSGREEALAQENRQLKREIASLEDEIASCASRVSASQDALSSEKAKLLAAERQLADARKGRQKYMEEKRQLQKEIDSLQQEIGELKTANIGLKTDSGRVKQTQESIIKELQQQVATLQQANDSQRIQTEAAEGSSKEQFDTLQQSYEAAKTELEEKSDLLRQQEGAIRQLRQEVQDVKQALSAAEAGLADYKGKATRILQVKDQLISDLKKARTQGAAGGEVATEEALLSIKEKLLDAEGEVATLKAKLDEQDEQHRQAMEDAEREVRAIDMTLLDERDLHAAVTTELKERIAEVSAARDEVLRQKQAIQVQLEGTSRTIQQLQKQLAEAPLSADAASAPSAEAQTKELSRALMQKQQELEVLRGERTNLVAQVEHERRLKEEALKVAHRHQTQRISGQWHDEMAMQPIVPASIGTSHSNFERRFQTAANAFDAFSIRLGVFLRRYPAARLMVLVYMVLLHFWVMIVLLTYQPEVHTSASAYHPQHPDFGTGGGGQAAEP